MSDKDVEDKIVVILRRHFLKYSDEVLEKYKSLLSQGCEGIFTWDFCYQNENSQEVCRIYVEKRGIDIHNIPEWPSIFQFLSENMLLLQNNFIEIQEFLKEELDLLYRER